jgi:hypothetical protein
MSPTPRRVIGLNEDIQRHTKTKCLSRRAALDPYSIAGILALSSGIGSLLATLVKSSSLYLSCTGTSYVRLNCRRHHERKMLFEIYALKRTASVLELPHTLDDLACLDFRTYVVILNVVLFCEISFMYFYIRQGHDVKQFQSIERSEP